VLKKWQAPMELKVCGRYSKEATMEPFIISPQNTLIDMLTSFALGSMTAM
jgi:hypothetical protein